MAKKQKPPRPPANTPTQASDRITFILNVIHQSFGEEPVPVQANYNRLCKGSEEVYSRKFTSTSEAKPLDLGWYENQSSKIGLIVIENLTGRGQMTKPSPEELLVQEQSIVYLRQSGDTHAGIYIPPGEVQPLKLWDPTAWSIVSNVPVKCKIWVFPK